MNKQITILDRNNQSISVDLICYFSNNNKKYIFYNKNETVQDGLIKMYVAEENMGLNTDISPEEWGNLKKIMQGIITGNTNNIEFLPYNSPVIFNEAKAIALNDTNINTIKSAYNGVVSNNVESVLNKDILTQNFGNATEVSSEPVQITPIPNVQNTFNMESNPVNLNTETPALNENLSITNEAVNDFNIPAVESVVSNDVSNENKENFNLDIPVIEPIIPSIDTTNNNLNILDAQPVENDIALNINSIKPGGIDSGFKVSNEPNIFDNPINITEEEINSSIDNTITNEVDDNNLDLNTKKIDSNNKKIELNNRKIKLFEELANIYREENELLGKEENENVNLENTASDLFNNNGTLNDSIIN